MSSNLVRKCIAYGRLGCVDFVLLLAANYLDSNLNSFSEAIVIHRESL